MVDTGHCLILSLEAGPLGYKGLRRVVYGVGIYGLLTNRPEKKACIPIVELFVACVGKGLWFLLIMDKADTETAN